MGLTVLFHAFSLDCFSGCIVHGTGGIVQPIVQVDYLYSVTGQETKAITI